MTKGWTEERRRKQAEAIKKWKPWEKSTGPRTEAGKARTRLNAVQERRHAETTIEARKILKLHRTFMMQWQKYLAADEKEIRKTNELMERLKKSKS